MMNRSGVLRLETRSRAKDEVKRVMLSVERVRKWEKKWVDVGAGSLKVFKWVPVSSQESDKKQVKNARKQDFSNGTEYPSRDNQSISSSAGDMNDDSNSSSPALPSSNISEPNQNHLTENGTGNHSNKRKHEDIEEPDNAEENGNDENSERDSFLQDENSNSGFDMNEDSNMTSFNGDETNYGFELDNSFDNHGVLVNNQDSNNHNKQINEESRRQQDQVSKKSNVVISDESTTVTYHLGMDMLHDGSTANNSKTSFPSVQSNFAKLKEPTKPERNILEHPSKDDTQKLYRDETTDQPLKHTGSPPP